MGFVAAGESSEEGLSDMSDVEVCQYLLSAEESALKETVWTQMNQDYLDAQAIKQAHQAAAAQARRRPPLLRTRLRLRACSSALHTPRRTADKPAGCSQVYSPRGRGHETPESLMLKECICI